MWNWNSCLKFIIFWILASIVGWIIGGMLVFPFVAESSSDFLSQKLPFLRHVNFSFSALAGFFSFGLVVGGAQYIVLRKHLHKSWMWMIATAIGFGVGFVVMKEIIPTKHRIDWLQWLVIALIQWIFLHRQLSRSFHWVLSNSFISAFLLISEFLSNNERNLNISQIEWLRAIVLFTGVVGLLTGTCMWWILQGPRKTRESAA
jgi:hypothetical protein